jgi:hypothetical protein
VTSVALSFSVTSVLESFFLHDLPATASRQSPQATGQARPGRYSRFVHPVAPRQAPPRVDFRQPPALKPALPVADIAQLVERQVVVLDVTGSSPVVRPIPHPLPLSPR